MVAQPPDTKQTRAMIEHIAARVQVILPCAVAMVIILSGCSAARSPLRRLEFTAPHMGVLVRLVVYCDNVETANKAASSAFNVIAALEQSMSDYRSDSEISELAHRAGFGLTHVSSDLLAVLICANEISFASDGAFDVTIGPVTQLWRQAKQDGAAPEQTALAEAHRLVNWRDLKLDADARSAELTKPGMRLDLGGIAKGYAGDCAIRVLRDFGITRCLVDLGGESVMGDPPPDRQGWTIALSAELQTTPLPTLELCRCAVATSGDTAQHLDLRNQRHSHIIDPRTPDSFGLTNPIAVTVIASDGMTADALATTLCVLGPQRGAGLLRQFPQTSARFVMEDENGQTVINIGEFPSAP